MKLRIWLLVLLLTCQPAMAGQRILLIRGLMDYVPGISPMSSLKSRLTDEGYEVTMITHLNDGSTKTNTGMPSLVTARELLTPCGMRVTLRAIILG